MADGRRFLTDDEIIAWKEYDAVLNKYQKTHYVKSYNRVSIHNNFPEIKAAFDHACAMNTFRILKDA